jgi:hypothetical protein
LSGWTVPCRHGEADSRVVLQLDPHAIRDLHQSTDLWIEMVLGDTWRWFMARVTALDPQTGRVATSLPASANDDGLRASRIGFLNTRGTLDDTSQCILEPEKSRIVFLEEPGIPAPAIELCVNPAPLFHLVDAAHVRLEGLNLSGGLASAIVAERCEDIHVVGCRIDQFGFAGIDLNGRRLRISGCHLSNLGTGGIRMSAGNPTTLDPGDATITACRIESWGHWKPIYEPGIRLQGVGIEVTECELSNGPHLAIEVDGNDHRIRRNAIVDVAREFIDMGAIYLNLGEAPLKRGTLIDANAFHSIGGRHALTHAVYVDRATCGVTITRNLFFRIAGSSDDSCAAIYANGPSDLVIAANLFAECAIALDLSFYLADWGRQTDLGLMRAGWTRTIEMLADPRLPHHLRYPELARFANEDRIFPRSNAFVDNVIWNAACPRAPFGPWRIRFGPAELVTQNGNIVADSDPAGLEAPRTVLARLIAGRSAAAAATAIEHALADWQAACVLLGFADAQPVE